MILSFNSFEIEFFLVKTSSGMSESYSSSASTAINQQSMTQSFRHGTTSTHTFSIAQPTYSQHTYDRHANNQPAHNQSTHKSIRHSSTCHVRRFDTTSHVQSKYHTRENRARSAQHSTTDQLNITTTQSTQHSTNKHTAHSYYMDNAISTAYMQHNIIDTHDNST